MQTYSENKSNSIYSPSSSSFSQNRTNQAKKRQESKGNLIHKLVKVWHDNFYERKMDVDECYNSFLNDYNQSIGLYYSRDNSVSKVLIRLASCEEFIQYDMVEEENRLKNTLVIMHRVLREKKFISAKQNLYYDQNFPQNDLKDSIHDVKQLLNDQGLLAVKTNPTIIYNQQNIDKLKKTWDIIIKIPMDQFWTYILHKQIQSKQLFYIFKTYVQVLKAQGKIELKKKVSEYLTNLFTKYSNQRKIIRQNNKPKLSEEEFNRKLEQKATQMSVYLNKEKWSRYQEQYLMLLQALRKRCENKDLKFEAFGSFRSKFYIINYSDIDFVLLYPSQDLRIRRNIIQVLKNIQQVLEIDNEKVVPGFSGCKPMLFDKIPNPFLKILYNQNYVKKNDIVASMDLLINNENGIENSKMLALYAENQYILKFCNLIKYWAIRKQLINLQSKINGMSSYGINLMTLYYLMVTEQIPYLKIKEKKYQIGISNDLVFKKSLLTNFKGFLEFYINDDQEQKKQYNAGKFHTQNHVVCLLGNIKNFQGYDLELIVNIHDFIDGSNPGRMKKVLSRKYYNIFSSTLQALEHRSEEFLQEIFCLQPQKISEKNKSRKFYSRRQKITQNHHIRHKA